MLVDRKFNFFPYGLWILPLAIFLLIAPFTPEWDLACAHFFFTPSPEGHGAFMENAFTSFFYHYGELFSFTVAGIAALIFILSWWIPKFSYWRKGALALMLAFVIGAGILVNGVLKECWGRPRPKQIVEFGGKHTFRPFYKPAMRNAEDPQKSFPSGHATVGFYFFSLCFVSKRYRYRGLFILGLTLSIGLGLSLSFTRIAQGGHFLSDVLTSALIMWFLCLVIDKFLFKDFIRDTAKLTEEEKPYTQLT